MKTKILRLTIILIAFFLLWLFLSTITSGGGDWKVVLQPSTRALLAGKNPYDNIHFLSPPWAFLVLIPPALLPPAMGSALFACIGAVGYLLTFYRLKAPRITLVFLIATPAFLAVLINPNFDWAVALGYTLPPQIGLFFVLTKPQIGAPLVFFWFIGSWREGGYRQVLRVFSPVVIAYGLSFLVFGPWVLHMGSALSSFSNIANVWPFGLLAGTVLLTRAIRLRKANLALIAGPFFSPYLAAYSWLPAIIGLLPGVVEVGVACFAYWVAWLLAIGVL